MVSRAGNTRISSNTSAELGEKSHYSVSLQLLDLPEVRLAGQHSKALLRQPDRLGIKKCFSHVFIPHGQVPISKMGLPEVKCS